VLTSCVVYGPLVSSTFCVFQLAEAESRLLSQQRIEEHLRTIVSELRETKAMEEEDRGTGKAASGAQAERQRLEEALAQAEMDLQAKERAIR
jgi:hypothetical protein